MTVCTGQFGESACRQDLEFCVVGGNTFAHTIIYQRDGTPVDLSTWQAKMDIRKSARDPEVIMTLTHLTDGGLTLGSDGSIQINIDATASSKIPHRAAWDLQLTDPAPDPDFVRTPVGGFFNVQLPVTRA